MNELNEGDVVTGQIEFNTNGSAYIKIDGVENDLYIYKKNTLNALHMDTVEVEVFMNNTKLEGKVLKIIDKFKTK